MNAREEPDPVKMRFWILALSLYTAGWLAMMSAFLVDNFDRELRWIGAWEELGWVAFLGCVLGPLLSVAVLLAGPVSPRIPEEAKQRSLRRAKVFLLTTLVAGVSLHLTVAFESGRFVKLSACLLAGWVVLIAPWVGLHHRWFTGDPRGSF